MKINQLIEILTKKIVNLEQLKNSAYNIGDLDQIEKLDLEINETKITLNILNQHLNQ